MREVYYCSTSRDHEHSTAWEADGCSELFELWQEAITQLLEYVREDEVEAQVNAALPEEEDD
jgi:hypothetical protein